MGVGVSVVCLLRAREAAGTDVECSNHDHVRTMGCMRVCAGLVVSIISIRIDINIFQSFLIGILPITSDIASRCGYAASMLFVNGSVGALKFPRSLQ